jgi:hypothetical protein
MYEVIEEKNILIVTEELEKKVRFYELNKLLS